MNKFFAILAATMLLGLSAFVSSAQAQSPTAPRTPGCTVDCDTNDQTSPGDPFNPPEPKCTIDCDPETGKTPDPDCQIDCDPGKPGDKPKPGQASLGDCGGKLGALRRVTVGQIKAVGSDGLVDIVPVCRAKTLSSEQDDVAQLRPAIGQNQVLDTALGRKGFNPEDVVGVIVNGRQVVLYVHPI